jgi:hypothetical protein
MPCPGDVGQGSHSVLDLGGIGIELGPGDPADQAGHLVDDAVGDGKDSSAIGWRTGSRLRRRWRAKWQVRLETGAVWTVSRPEDRVPRGMAVDPVVGEPTGHRFIVAAQIRREFPKGTSDLERQHRVGGQGHKGRSAGRHADPEILATQTSRAASTDKRAKLGHRAHAQPNCEIDAMRQAGGVDREHQLRVRDVEGEEAQVAVTQP